ncbi:MAG: DegV family protein [Erysipelotrichaceae bacterium]|nr:DegV family protein [Erysipelotrichaceae bacterium]
MIRIVTDSTSDIPCDVRKKYNIEVLPLRIHISENEYLDGENIVPDKLFSLVSESGEFPKTSAINIAMATDMFDRLTANGDEVIALSLASVLSSNYNVMCLAREACDHPELVSVIDTRNLSIGIYALAMEAADMIEEGMKREEIVKELESIRDKVKVMFVLDTMDYLAMGGRCSSLVSSAGDALSLHPAIRVCDDGTLKMYRMYRGSGDHLASKFMKDCLSNRDQIRCDRIYFGDSGDDPQREENLYNLVDNTGEFRELRQTKAGCVISSHCGPGCIGAAYIEK